MPNIIEQQDLLKGLPDDRLAMMMQAPAGDIPPFLVAAEAQRRQSIREQFSGGPQESVVDTLTKQLASVPQNIQAAPQMPPRMPPPQMPPQMAGVGALPQGMPPQAMRHGGYVQRYNDGSLVQPSVSGLAQSITGMTEEEYIAEQERKKLEGLGRGKARYLLENPTTPRTEAEIAEQNFKAATEGPFSSFYSPASVYEAAQSLTKIEEPKSDPYSYGMTRDERRMMQVAAPQPPVEVDPGKKDTSAENQNKMSIDAYKKELEAIYGVKAEDSQYLQSKLEEFYAKNEISDWEKAQKWFAAAQAAVEPGQNNVQATINAISALGGGMAQERATERENQQALAEALLKLEVGDRQDRRQAEQTIAKGLLDYKLAEIEDRRASEAAGRKEQLAAYELYAGGADKTVDSVNQFIKSLMLERQEYIKSLPKDEVTGEPKVDPNDPVLRNYDLQIKSYRNIGDAALAQRGSAYADYGKITGTNPAVTVFTGDSLATYNR